MGRAGYSACRPIIRGMTCQLMVDGSDGQLLRAAENALM